MKERKTTINACITARYKYALWQLDGFRERSVQPAFKIHATLPFSVSINFDSKKESSKRPVFDALTLSNSPNIEKHRKVCRSRNATNKNANDAPPSYNGTVIIVNFAQKVVSQDGV
uniref:Uncharacterized protein n=1 Tax=Panagrellus redivivus TaxID=6233 RepID=A0A7E4ZSB5_PANRE